MSEPKPLHAPTETERTDHHQIGVSDYLRTAVWDGATKVSFVPGESRSISIGTGQSGLSRSISHGAELRIVANYRRTSQLCQAIQTLWVKHSNKETCDEQYSATVDGLMGIGPKDELEGMIAAQLLAAHNAAMECYRRALLAEQSFEGRRENLSQANRLSRTYALLPCSAAGSPHQALTFAGCRGTGSSVTPRWRESRFELPVPRNMAASSPVSVIFASEFSPREIRLLESMMSCGTGGSNPASLQRRVGIGHTSRCGTRTVRLTLTWVAGLKASRAQFFSAESGTASAAAWKPIFVWVPSQNGFFVDAPQRQSTVLS